MPREHTAIWRIETKNERMLSESRVLASEMIPKMNPRQENTKRVIESLYNPWAKILDIVDRVVVVVVVFCYSYMKIRNQQPKIFMLACWHVLPKICEQMFPEGPSLFQERNMFRKVRNAQVQPLNSPKHQGNIQRRRPTAESRFGLWRASVNAIIFHAALKLKLFGHNLS